MLGSTVARVLVALCIGSAVKCMPNRTHKTRRQAQQHHASSVSQDGCIENGHFYAVNDQWERPYLGSTLVCTCQGVAGIKCTSKPDEEETCFDKINQRSYTVGETYERPKDGMIWDCTCIGSGRGKISCTIGNRCHEGGASYKIGDTWRRPHETGGYMLECVCLGNGKGEWTCKPIAERCYDNNAGTSYVVGETWEKPYQGWMVVDCTCLGEGSGRITCTSRNRCNDQDTLSSYRIGDTWTKSDARGNLLQCLCTGNGRGEWKCERHASLHTTGLGTGSRVITNIQPVVYQPASVPELPQDGPCRSDAGLYYFIGQRWIKNQGTQQMLCTCLGNGISCEQWDGPAPVYGGNSGGQPCVFPFVYKGKTYHSCTSDGRSDRQLWCSTSSDFEAEQKYSFCTEQNAIITTRGGNSNGALCQFPYTYNGRNYTDCTSDGRRDGMKWCGTTTDYDDEHRFGFCPMAAHEEVCTTTEGVMYRVGDQWDKRHDVLGHMMRCTCVGNGRGEWSCVAYSQLKDQCIVDGLTYDVNQTFTKQHEEGYTMNCTCFGQGRGRWKCDAIDQCQEPETRAFYQIGQSWDKMIHGIMYKCYCYGNGIGELSCEPQQSYPGGQRPVQVIITESGNQPNSHPIQWNAPSSAHITQYVLKWRAKNSHNPWREVIIPGHLNSYTISGLKPGVTYEGQLVSVLRFGRREVTRFDFTTTYGSLATSHGETTNPPPVVDISESITEITSSSFVISWVSASDTVSGFRVEYELNEQGQGPGQPIVLDLPRSTTSVNINELLPGRKYTVNVYEVTDGGEDNLILTTSQTTAPDAPVEHEVEDVGETSIVISWDKPLAPITGYRVVYTPSVEGESTELILPDTATSVTLSELRPGLLYNISIYAVEDSLESEPVFVQVNTAGDPLPDEVKSPSDLQFFEVSDKKIVLTWTGPAADVSGYRVTVVPVDASGTPQTEMTLPVSENSYIEVTHLEPGTHYRFNIYTINNGEESLPLVGEQFTKPDAPTDIHFMNVTDNSAVMLWYAPRAKVTGYRLFLTVEGSTPKQLLLPARQTQYTLVNLKPDTKYTATLHSEIDNTLSEGESAVFTTTPPMGNGPQFTTDVTDTSIFVSWTPIPHIGYKLTVRPSQGREAPRDVTSDSGSIYISGLTPGVEYTYSIQPMLNGQEQGTPVTKRVTTQPDAPTDIHFMNVTDDSAVMLWYAPRAKVTGYRLFLTIEGSTPKQLKLPARQTQYTLVNLKPDTKYTATLHSEIYNTLSEGESAVFTTTPPMGNGPQFSTDVTDTSIFVSWTPIPHVGYKLTVRPSQGGEAPRDVTSDSGSIYISGLTPGVEYTYSIQPMLNGQEQGIPVTKRVTTQPDAPTDIHFMKVTEDSAVMLWYAPRAKVTGYRLFLTVEGSTPKQLKLPAHQTQYTLVNLKPDTKYTATLHSEIDNTLSEGESAVFTTTPPIGNGPQFSTDVTDTSIFVSWTPIPHVGYKLTVRPSQGGEAPRDDTSDSGSIYISGLTPGVEYTYSVQPMLNGQEQGTPVTRRITTQPDAPTDIHFMKVTEDSAVMLWYAPRAKVTGYRLFLTIEGSTPKQLKIPAHQTQYTLVNLKPDTKYTATLHSEIGNTLSEGESAVFTTTPPMRNGPQFSTDVTDTSIFVSWTPIPHVGYKLTVRPSQGGEAPRDDTSDSGSIYISGLTPGVEYTYSVQPMLNGQEQGTPVTRRVTTQPDAPTDIHFMKVTEDSAVMLWYAPRAKVTGYRLFLTIEGSTPKQLKIPAHQTQYTLVNLKPDTKYTATLHSEIGNTLSEGESAVFTTTPPMGNVPQFSTDVTDTSIFVSWTPIPNIDYKLTVRPSQGGEAPRDVTSDSGSIYISGLTPGVEYTYSIQPMLNGQEQGTPVTKRVTTQPDAPTDIHFMNVTDDSAVMLWYAPRAKVTGYRLFLTIEGSTPKQLLLPARQTQYTLVNLKPDTKYTATLHSEIDNTLSEGESAVFTTTLPMGNGPQLSTDVTDTSILVSWTPIPNIGYKLTVRPSQGGEAPRDDTSDSGSIYISGLTPGVEYTYSIQPMLNGQEQGTPVTKRVTTQPDAPTDIHFMNVTEDSAVMLWYAPRAKVTGYRLFLTIEGSTPKQLLLPARQTQYMLVNLKPDTKYTTTLHSEIDNTLSEGESAVFTTTSPMGNGPQFSTDVTDTSIFVSWTPIPNIEYKLTVRPSQGGEAPRDVTSDSGSIYISGLTPGVEYTYSVQPVLNGQEQGIPVTKRITTQPDAPTDIHFMNVTEDSAVMLWYAPRAKVTGYRLFLTIEGSTPKQLKLPTRLTQYTLVNLKPDTEYTATLHSEIGNTLSEGESAVFTTTPPMGNVPQFSTDVTDTSIIVSWTPIPNIEYKLTVRPSQGGEAPRDVTSDSGSIYISGLTPGVEYTYSVQPVLNGQEQGIPVTKRVTTPLTPPTDLNLESKPGSGEVTVQWSSTDVPDITGYKVMCTPTNGQQGNSVQEFVKAGQTSCTLDNLSPGIEYNISVVTVKDDMESTPVYTTITPEVPQLTDLSFDDVGDTSISLRWSPLNTTAVTGYRITVVAAGESVPIFEDMVQPTTGFYRVYGLEPGIDYDISVITVTEHGESEPTTLTQQTSVPAPTDLTFGQSGPNTLAVSWVAPHVPNRADINSYLIRYHPIDDEDDNTETSVGGNENSVVLRHLIPNTEYLVSVVCVYEQRESSPVVGTMKTALDTPVGLRFSEIYTTSFTVHWLPPQSKITGYRIRHQMSSGGRTKEEKLPPSRNHFTITGLAPDTEYIVNITAVSGTKASAPLGGKQKTISDAPTDLTVLDSTPTSITVRWDAPPVTVRYYRITHGETGGHSNPREFTVPGSQSTATISNLNPGTDYTVTVYAVTGRGDSPASSTPIYVTHKTGVDSPTDMQVKEVNDHSVTVRWTPAQGPIKGYRVTGKPRNGQGPSFTEVVAPDQTEFTFSGLMPSSEYIVSVSALGRDGESTPLVVNALTTIDRPKDLSFSDVDSTSLRITWDSPEGVVTSYRVFYASSEEGERELYPAPRGDAESAVIYGLQPGTEYTVKVIALHDDTESTPVIGVQATPISPPTNLQFSQVGPTSFTISWSGTGQGNRLPGLTGLTGYRVVVNPKNKSGPTKELNLAPDTTQAHVSGLMIATTYEVHVYALKDSLTSRAVQGEVTTVESISPPRRVRISDVNDSAITLTWRSKTETISGFLVEATPTSPSSTFTPIQRTIGADSRSYSITGLEPGTTYKINIYTLKGNGRSAPLTLTATTAKPVVIPPTDIRFTSLNPTSISFTWELSRSPGVTGYYVTYEEVGGLPRELTPRPHEGQSYATINGLKPGTSYIIKIVALQNALRSSPLAGKAKTQPAPDQILVPELPRLPVPHRPTSDILDVPETFDDRIRFDVNHIHLSGTGGQSQPGQQGQHIYTEYQSLGPNNGLNGLYNGPKEGQRPTFREPLVYIPLAGPDGNRVPLVKVSDGPLPGLAYGFPDNETEIPQEAQTITTISWQPIPQTSEYEVSCNPLTHLEERGFQMRLPGTSNSATLIGLTSGASYNVLIEAMKGGAKEKVLEEVVTVGNTVPGDIPLTPAPQDVCFDTFTHTYHEVGSEWERMSETGFKLWCRCLGLGSGHFRCDSSKWCHDNGNNYRIGEKWDRRGENGHMMSCTCLGNGKGEFKCEPHESTCYDDGKMYQIGNQWQKEYLGAICTCTCYGGQQGWRCENCRRPGVNTDIEADLLQPVHTDVFDRYRENALKKLNIHCPIECLRPELLADAQSPSKK